MKVQNRLTDEDTKLAVELNFKTHGRLRARPRRRAGRPALKELLEMRQELTQLLSKMEGNDKLEQLLAEVLSNTDKAQELAKQMGIGESAGSTTETPGAETNS